MNSGREYSTREGRDALFPYHVKSPNGHDGMPLAYFVKRRELRMYYQIEKMDGYYRIGSPENTFCYLAVGTDKAMRLMPCRRISKKKPISAEEPGIYRQ